METVIVLNPFSALLCALLFVTKNSIYLSKNAPGNEWCFALTVEWSCYFLGYGCIIAAILKVLGHFRFAVFFLLCAVSYYFEKKGERKEWDDLGWKYLGQ